MTIQQKAIEQLERISRHLATIGEKEDYTGVAIQALEQECEDAVSRQAVLDIVKFEKNWLSDAKSNNADTDIAFSCIRTQVAKLSPVTSAQKWIPSDRLPEDCISRKALLDKKWDVPSSNVVERKKIEKAIDEIQKLRGCSCSCSDGIIDDVENILDKLIESEKSE